MQTLSHLTATQIINAKGFPAIEVTAYLEDGTYATASCPSGTSVGSFEAKELLDNDPMHFQKRGVTKAIALIHTTITKALKGIPITNQEAIDTTLLSLDQTDTKEVIGANTMLSVSLACCKLAAKSQNLPLYTYIASLVGNTNPFRIPTPLFNLINGGKHGTQTLSIQEFFVIPHTKTPYPLALERGAAIYHKLKDTLLTQGLSCGVGDEGGFSPPVNSTLAALRLLQKACEDSLLTPHKDIHFGIDAAATTFAEGDTYRLSDSDHPLSTDELISWYRDLLKAFPLLYLEDPLKEDDFSSWQKAKDVLASQTILCGDDLTVTNPKRFAKAVQQNCISGVIIKPNQIGTLSETLTVVKEAQRQRIPMVVSHRSGETNDDFIADFAVGVGVDFVKFGAPARGERVAKYNRLLHIYQQITTS